MKWTRIGQLELRRTSDKKMFEIVKWYPNEYYGKEHEYEKNGEWYVRDGEPMCRVHENLFSSPELCYTIAFIDKGVPCMIKERCLEFDTKKELKTIFRLGCSRRATSGFIAAEILIIAACSVVLAMVLFGLAWSQSDELIAQLIN